MYLLQGLFSNFQLRAKIKTPEVKKITESKISLVFEPMIAALLLRAKFVIVRLLNC